jgi:hypothetical protein
MTVECNAPPQPDAVVISRPDVIIDGELLPVLRAPPPAPPPLPPPPPPRPPNHPVIVGIPRPPQVWRKRR